MWLRVALTYLSYINKLERDVCFLWQAESLLKQAAYWLSEAIGEGVELEDAQSVAGEIRRHAGKVKRYAEQQHRQQRQQQPRKALIH